MSDPIQFEGATPRLALPLLFAGQAQKEFFVNEALLRADLLLHCVVEGEAATPPVSPDPGQAWLVSPAATGAFAGREDGIAGWTTSGWRFVEPREGLQVYDRSLQAFRLFSDEWQVPASLAAPSGGSTVDAEARAAIVSILESLAAAGILTVV